jgi:hypothetical protein
MVSYPCSGGNLTGLSHDQAIYILQSKLPPIVLTKWPINSGKAQKYATMEYNVAGKVKLTECFAMLLKALVVRSTRQKDESLSEDSK